MLTGKEKSAKGVWVLPCMSCMLPLKAFIDDVTALTEYVNSTNQTLGKLIQEPDPMKSPSF